MSDLTDRYHNAWHTWVLVEEELCEYALALFGVSEEDIKHGNNWPFEDVTSDQVDWDGMSLELKGARDELEPTPEQLERAYVEHGFDVIDIQYGDDRNNYKRFYPEATKQRHAEFAAKYPRPVQT